MYRFSVCISHTIRLERPALLSTVTLGFDASPWHMSHIPIRTASAEPKGWLVATNALIHVQIGGTTSIPYPSLLLYVRVENCLARYILSGNAAFSSTLTHGIVVVTYFVITSYVQPCISRIVLVNVGAKSTGCPLNPSELVIQSMRLRLSDGQFAIRCLNGSLYLNMTVCMQVLNDLCQSLRSNAFKLGLSYVIRVKIEVYR